MKHSRSFWAYLLLLSYTSLLAANSLTHGMFVGVAFALALAAALVLTFRALPPGDQPSTQSQLRLARAAIAFGLASFPFAAAARSPGLAAVAALILGISTSLTVLVVARTEAQKSLLSPPASLTSPDAALVVAFVSTFAFALPAAVVLEPNAARFVTDSMSDVATVAAGATGLLLLAYVALRNLIGRPHDVGLYERSMAALLSAAIALVVGISSVFAAGFPAERAIPCAAACAAWASSLAACAPSEADVDKARRLLFAIAVFVAPIAVLLAAVAKRNAAQAPLLVVLAALGSASIALFFRIRNEPPRLVRALDEALVTLRTHEPHAAIGAALGMLRAATPQYPIGAALYLCEPPLMFCCDRSGALIEEQASFPERVFSIAKTEPYRIIRLRVLEAAQVRHPEVRDLVEWMASRDFDYLAPLYESGAPSGVFALAAHPARSLLEPPPRMEEIRALRSLADQFSTLVAAVAQMKRSEHREVELRRKIEQVVAQQSSTAKLAQASASTELLKFLARGASAAAYSAAARFAIQRIGDLAAQGKPAMLLTAPGIDYLAWVALYHLNLQELAPGEGPPAGLALVDGSDPRLADLELWRDPVRSPLHRAERATLALLFPEELPKLVQAYVAVELAHAESSSVHCITVSSRTVDTLVALGKLDERLALLIDDRVVALPTLDQRAEDLRAIVIEELASLGRRFYGEVASIEPQAFALLTERHFPGNDAELLGLLYRALSLSRGRTINRSQLMMALQDADATDKPAPARSSVRTGR